MKKRKSNYCTQKAKVQTKIVEVYHERNGIPGYRMMFDLLSNMGIHLSKCTIHKYMKELNLRSITRRKKVNYTKGIENKIFPNLLNQDFITNAPNQIWCTDFTYLYLSNGKIIYNCTIIDLYNRAVVATLNSNHITADLAIETLKIAIRRHKPKAGIILHSDQGSQFTSKRFNLFCEQSKIQQSMSKAGCPYDNAPMERYYNTLKSELINHFSYKTKQQLDISVSEFAYAWYNSVRPHTFNSGKPPYYVNAA